MAKSPKETEDLVSSMAKQLLHGATLTGIACPNCDTPLLRRKDDTLYCPKCERPVVVVDSMADIPKEPTSQPATTQSQIKAPLTQDVFMRLQEVLLSKLQILTETVAAVSDPAKLRDLLPILRELLTLYTNTPKPRTPN